MGEMGGGRGWGGGRVREKGVEERMGGREGRRGVNCNEITNTC